MGTRLRSYERGNRFVSGPRRLRTWVGRADGSSRGSFSSRWHQHIGDSSCTLASLRFAGTSQWEATDVTAGSSMRFLNCQAT